MNKVSVLLIVSLLVGFFQGCQRTVETKEVPSPKSTIQTIAFGSCSDQRQPQPVLNLVAARRPDLFIYLGDNIYSDTYSMDTLRLNYDILGAKSEFQRLKANTTILATWDDHDFGWNDSGRHYPFKEESKKIFLQFFGPQGDSSIYDHPGIYHTASFGEPGKRVQVVFLDTRTFRDKLVPYNGNRQGQAGYGYALDYSPHTSTDSTLLGEMQWQWLEGQLKQPADLRIIASSTQFGITHNGYEAWANFPHEQQRFIDLVKSTRANGIVFISGDVHYAELSRFDTPGVYPLYDLTSSGITSTWDFATPNDHRMGDPVMENNYGWIQIDWEKSPAQLSLEIHDVASKQRIKKEIKLDELMWKK